MIIDNIDVTTKEGVKEFNEKYKGNLLVKLDEDGGVTLTGIGKEQPTITHDTYTGMFGVEKEGKTKQIWI